MIEVLVCQPDLLSILAGLAFATAFDLFLRPSETLDIKREDIVEPKGGGARLN